VGAAELGTSGCFSRAADGVCSAFGFGFEQPNGLHAAMPVRTNQAVLRSDLFGLCDFIISRTPPDRAFPLPADLKN